METECKPVAASRQNGYLTCEKWWIYALMMLAGGYFGAFTYSIRGGVFCNAQTGNFVLLAMALGNGNWRGALYFLIPISAYCLGAFVSEAAERRAGHARVIRWETSLVLFEMIVVLFLGFLPENAPVQITQVLINFICSMQYNTFRQAEGIPMATTFCTNHIRQVGISLYGILARDGKQVHVRKLLAHAGMLAAFVAGGVASAFLCGRFLGRAVWFAEIPLGAALVELLWADLKKNGGISGRFLMVIDVNQGLETSAERMVKVSPAFSKAVGSRGKAPGRAPQSAKCPRRAAKLETLLRR